jgi:hypothetical protein
MVDDTLVVTVHRPSAKKIATACVIALFVATALLFIAILPAEYGIDPLGTGKALRLTDLAKADAAKLPEKPADAAPAKAGEATNTIAPVWQPAADGGAPTVKGAFIPQPKVYKVDSREIKSRPLTAWRSNTT